MIAGIFTALIVLFTVMLNQTFMNIFLLDSNLFHHAKNLFSVCKFCAP